MRNYNSMKSNVIEKELTIVLNNMIEVAEKENTYSKEISKILLQLFSNSGKKIRPTITLLSSNLWGEPENQNNINIATAVELLHVATLLHDDTVDKAESRRGKQTPSSLWGKEVAVLLGDYIFASSAIFVSKLPATERNGTIGTKFANTIVELSRGELTEFLERGISKINKKTYFDRIYNKTGSLFKTAAFSGALCGKATETQANIMGDFGYNIGMAFQIQDDIIDFASQSIITGKPSIKDLSEGIVTLPSIIFMKDNPSDNSLIDFLNDFPQLSIEKYKKATESILNSDSIKKSKLIVNKFINKALENLKSTPNSKYKNSLIELIQNIHDREK